MREPPAPSGSAPVILAVGSITGLMVVVLALSFAILVYSGEGGDPALGAGLFLLGAGIMNLISARGSSLPGVILQPQDSTSAVVAVALSAMIPGVAAGEQLGTLFVYILIATALAGIAMLLLGLLRLGELVRLVPYPVIGGFLAGTGWLLVAGAAELVTNGFAWSAVAIGALIAAVGFGLTLVIVLRRRPNIVIFPIMVIGGMAVFYMILAATGTTLDEARALGLLSQVPATTFRLPVSDLLSVDWSAIASGIGGLLTVPVVATLALLLNVSGLELVADKEADLNRELRVAGTANLVASLTGSTAGYHALGPTSIGYRVNVASRWVPLIAATLCLLAIAGGTTLVGLLPTPLVGGILVLVGFSFLADWVLDGRRQMTGPEYLLMLAIMVAVAFLGFLAAVLLGMAAAVALFAVAYSRVDPVRHVSTGRERRSTMARSPAEHRVMQEQGASIVIIELQGYLFFGTARSLLARAREIVDTTPQLSCLLIDLRRVQGTDSTALASFVKLLRLASREQIRLILSDLPADLEGSLNRAVGEVGAAAGVAGDLDRAMEMAEDHVLGEERRGAGETTLADIFGADLWAKIQPRLDRYDVETGGLLIDHGDTSAGLFLVDYGRIVAEIPGAENRWQRVVSCGPGTILGEMSLYLGPGRSARLRAEEPTCVFTLSPEAIASLEESDPKAAAELHRRLATVIAERLAISNETVGALLR